MNTAIPTERAAIIVVGLGYGDEAKGATVDALAAHVPDTTAVVRWSGGAQTAHNVIHGSRHHTFRQFGSATFLDIPTYLSAPMLFAPDRLLAEAETLQAKGIADPLGLITVDARCLVTTPIHRALNQAREIARGASAHGSCGHGIGETVAYDLASAAGSRRGDSIGNFPVHADLPMRARAPRVGDLADVKALTRQLDDLARYAKAFIDDHGTKVSFGSVTEMAQSLHEAAGAVRVTHRGDDEMFDLLSQGSVIFEGSQGVLLDQDYGFHPHTTWATTVPRDLRARLTAGGVTPFTLGLTRSYSTRHGYGPMPTESTEVSVHEPHNGTGRFQGAWRQGHLDLAALRYAVFAAGGVDGISVSHIDGIQPKVAASWGHHHDPALYATVTEHLSDKRTHLAQTAQPHLVPVRDTLDLLTRIEQVTGAPVVLTANGPARKDRMFARATVGSFAA